MYPALSKTARGPNQLTCASFKLFGKRALYSFFREPLSVSFTNNLWCAELGRTGDICCSTCKGCTFPARAEATHVIWQVRAGGVHRALRRAGETPGEEVEISLLQTSFSTAVYWGRPLTQTLFVSAREQVLKQIGSGWNHSIIECTAKKTFSTITDLGPYKLNSSQPPTFLNRQSFPCSMPLVLTSLWSEENDWFFDWIWLWPCKGKVLSFKRRCWDRKC